MAGVRRVFHCAADYRLYARRPQEIYESNVDGTQNVMQAASEANVEKVVYTSSVATLAFTRDGKLVDEGTPTVLEQIIGHYKRSKFLAERVADEWAARGLPLVIVSPTTPVGEGDVKPTPTGKIIVDFLAGKMVAWVDTGMNLVDVRDVAEGHLIAAERGRVGEKYLLGNRNLTLKELFGILSRLTGVREPSVKLPHWVPLTVAGIENTWARFRGRAPKIPLEGVRMSRYKMYADCSKAIRELGFPQSSVEGALGRAVAWFRSKSGSNQSSKIQSDEIEPGAIDPECASK